MGVGVPRLVRDILSGDVAQQGARRPGEYAESENHGVQRRIEYPYLTHA